MIVPDLYRVHETLNSIKESEEVNRRRMLLPHARCPADDSAIFANVPIGLDSTDNPPTHANIAVLFHLTDDGTLLPNVSIAFDTAHDGSLHTDVSVRLKPADDFPIDANITVGFDPPEDGVAFAEVLGLGE